MESVDKTVENSSVFSLTQNVLVAVSKGMRAVKLCTNKILAVLNWRCRLMQVDLYNGSKMVVVVV